MIPQNNGMELKDILTILISLLSVIIAYSSVISTRKNFLLSLANDRAKKVNQTFEKQKGDKRAPSLSDQHILFWSEIVSEIIVSKIIIEKITGSNQMIKVILKPKDIHTIFWQQVNTSIRTQVKEYTEYVGLEIINGDDTVPTFRTQMKTIKEFYHRLN